jgi:sodium transport system permease protein
MSVKALTVFRKETLDALRDRRSLGSALIYSLFGPLVMVSALASMAPRDAALELAVAGAERAPSLVRFLEQNGVTVRPSSSDVRAAVRSGGLDLALAVPEDYAGDFRASRPARLELVHDASRNDLRRPVQRTRELIERYNTQVAAQRLTARGVSPGVAQPVRLAEVDLSTAASRAALALGTFPIFLLMATFIGGMNVAIDATAGERERGSLEPLLVQDVSRADLALGKWMAAAAFNLLGVGLTVLVSYLTLRWDRLERLDVPVALSGADALRLLALLIPLAVFAPALQMLVALFARSFKEAQTWLSLLLFVPILPGFVFAFRRIATEPWMHGTPMLAQQVLISDLLRGQAAGPAAHALAAAATLAAAALCVAVTARMLSHERIVLGR